MYHQLILLFDQGLIFSLFIDRKKPASVRMLLVTLQCIASVLPWQLSFSFSAFSCMVSVVVKILDLEYRMASGVSRS